MKDPNLIAGHLTRSELEDEQDDFAQYTMNMIRSKKGDGLTAQNSSEDVGA